jgi:hypothetical protein
MAAYLGLSRTPSGAGEICVKGRWRRESTWDPTVSDFLLTRKRARLRRNPTVIRANLIEGADPLEDLAAREEKRTPAAGGEELQHKPETSLPSG